MISQATGILCRRASRAARGRLPVVRQLALVGALVGGLGLGIALRSASSAPASATLAPALAPALAAISPAPNEGGPWVP